MLCHASASEHVMMDNDPLVSCIITTFNRPQALVNAIESVLVQSYQHFEIIVVDDNSTHAYDAVHARYQQHDKIQFVANPRNLGISASRNLGISMAKGNYLAFVDDDDRWLPTKLASQLQFLQDNPAYLACSTCHIDSQRQIRIDRGKRHITLETMLGENILGSPSKIMLRRSALHKAKFNEQTNHAEDWDFYLQLLHHGDIYVLPEALVIYNTQVFGRLTTGFAALSLEQIQQKAAMTYANRSLIGEKNFKTRMAHYYFDSFLQRKNKGKYFQQAVREVGFFLALRIMLKVIRRSVW